MRTTNGGGQPLPIATAAVAPVGAPDPRLSIPLEPVDHVTITTPVDNVTDLLATDAGPARRPFIGAAQRALAERFPAAFVPNTVGTRFQL